MELNTYKNLILERERFKRDIWTKFCSKEYPARISDSRFLTIFLNQAQKTYHRYVSYYCWINWVDLDVLSNRLSKIETQLMYLFNKIVLVMSVFKAQLQKIHLQQGYEKILYAIEDFSFGVIDDRIRAQKLSIENLKKSLQLD